MASAERRAGRAGASLLPSADRAAADLRVSVAEAMNPARRPQMEDRHVLHAAGDWPLAGSALDDLAYLAVYDGHGGRDMVDFLEHSLSHHLANELLSGGTAGAGGVKLATRLERAFLLTDIHALQAGISSSGATVACCLVEVSDWEGAAAMAGVGAAADRSRDGGSLTRHTYCLLIHVPIPLSPCSTLAPQRLGPTRIRVTAANAGDARVVVGRTVPGGATRPLRMTRDHTAQDPSEVSRIEQAGGFVFRNRVMGVLAITRSLGDHQLKPFVIAHPHVQETTLGLEEDAFLVVACDGLWDVVSDQQAVDLVRQYEAAVASDPDASATSPAQFLVDEALRRGTNDNVTVLVAFYRRP